MLTRCPNCDTTFRVTPTQLKARAGTVRCGQCHFVFNALDTLADIPADFAEGSRTPSDLEPTEEPRDELLSDWGPLEENRPWTAPLDEAADADAAIEPAYDYRDVEPAVDTGDAAPDAEEPLSGREARRHEEPAEAYEAGDEPTHAPALPAVEPAPSDYLASPVLHAPASSGPRWPWRFGSALAVLLLALQLTYYYRVELAALRPEWRPALLSMCATLGCDVPRPRHIDAISIESSDLRPDPQHVGHLALSATLRSRSPLAQEWPLLELTLTDVADRRLAVRHFGARDYLAKDGRLAALLAAGFPANGEIPVTLALDIGDLQAAGYRLYVFYP